MMCVAIVTQPSSSWCRPHATRCITAGPHPPHRASSSSQSSRAELEKALGGKYNSYEHITEDSHTLFAIEGREIWQP